MFELKEGKKKKKVAYHDDLIDGKQASSEEAGESELLQHNTED